MSHIQRRCKNMTTAKNYVRNILSKYLPNQIIENIIIKELVKYHPTKKINVDKVEWFKIKIRPPYNKPALFFKYKNNEKEDDISWHLCIKNLYGKYKYKKEHEANIKQAFRNESHKGTKRQYFFNNIYTNNNKLVGKCFNKDCGILTEKITVDHYPIVYQKILDDFIVKENIKLHDVDIYEDENNEIRISDKNLASKWLDYHDNIAQYRFLCKSCNSHFGSYGYKSISSL